MWRFVAEETGAEIVRVPVSLPATSPEAIVDAFRQRIDAAGRVMAIPHIAAEPSLVEVADAAVGVFDWAGDGFRRSLDAEAEVLSMVSADA